MRGQSTQVELRFRDVVAIDSVESKAIVARGALLNRALAAVAALATLVEALVFKLDGSDLDTADSLTRLEADFDKTFVSPRLSP